MNYDVQSKHYKYLEFLDLCLTIRFHKFLERLRKITVLLLNKSSSRFDFDEFRILKSQILATEEKKKKKKRKKSRKKALLKETQNLEVKDKSMRFERVNRDACRYYMERRAGIGHVLCYIRRLPYVVWSRVGNYESMSWHVLPLRKVVDSFP